MNIDAPFAFDAHGRTARTGDADHVRDMIEMILFTSPGERVNRPDFGSGLLQALFAPNSPELATALQYSTQAALHKWLGDLIEIHQLEFTAEDATLRARIEYSLRRTGERRAETFVRTGTP